MRKFDKTIVKIVLGAIITCFGAVWSFTHNAFIDGFNLSDTGQIGDTIGGICGPILNLAGMVIVYYSFMEQKRANDNQVEELNKQQKRAEIDKEITFVTNTLTVIKYDLQNVFYYDGIKVEGADAIKKFFDFQVRNPDTNIFLFKNPIRISLVLIINDFHHLLNYISHSRLDKDQKKRYFENIVLLYYWNIGIFFIDFLHSCLLMPGLNKFEDNTMYKSLYSLNKKMFMYNRIIHAFKVEEPGHISILQTLGIMSKLYG